MTERLCCQVGCYEKPTIVYVEENRPEDGFIFFSCDSHSPIKIIKAISEDFKKMSVDEYEIMLILDR